MELDFFDDTQLSKELCEVGDLQKIAFSASCVERIFPFYEQFSQDENWGNPKLLQEIVDGIWEILECGEILTSRILNFKFKMAEDDISPCDDDEFDGNSLFVEASEVASAIDHLLELCLDVKDEYALACSQDTRNAIEYYIDGFDPTFQDLSNAQKTRLTIKSLREHPLVMREMSKQSKDLQTLKESSPFNLQVLASLRSSSREYGQLTVTLFSRR